MVRPGQDEQNVTAPLVRMYEVQNTRSKNSDAHMRDKGLLRLFLFILTEISECPAES